MTSAADISTAYSGGNMLWWRHYAPTT